MTDTDKMLTPDEIKSTQKLQFESLLAYMYGLGYYWMSWEGNYFSSDEYKNKARKHISFNTAVELYNGKYNDNHGNLRTNAPFDFNVYSLTKAEAAKTVRKVKLQLSKKTGFIRVSSHIVEFTKPVYYQMFISSKYFPF